jgi:hypothetical protein
MEHVKRGPGGYYLVEVSSGQIDIIERHLNRFRKLPRSKIFDCESSLASRIKSADEGNNRDTFVFTLPGKQPVMLTTVDFQGDYSGIRHPKDVHNVKVGDAAGVLTLLIAEGGGKKSRWVSSWRAWGAFATLYIEDEGNPVLKPEEVLKISESINCKRIP